MATGFGDWTRGTIYLIVLKVDHTPFFVKVRKRSEETLIQVVGRFWYRGYPVVKWRSWSEVLKIENISRN